jgi:glucose-6-phosphate isomerase
LYRYALGKDAVKKHMVAVSTNLKLVSEFGGAARVDSP